MALSILTPLEQSAMRRAGRAAAATLHFVGQRLRPGLTTAEIDTWVRQDTRKRGGAPAQLGFQGFPRAVCTSRNHVVCHGIPSEDERLNDGDIINVDVTTCLDGWHGDTSRTFLIGRAAPEAKHVVEVAELCRSRGIAAIRPGVRLGEIGSQIEEVAKQQGCSVVREFGGHGIGRAMHEPPHVPHHAFRGGLRLRAGMALTIEPMVNLGGPDTLLLADGWTVVTRDGSLSAQHEHTVLVTDTGYEILTPWPDF